MIPPGSSNLYTQGRLWKGGEFHRIEKNEIFKMKFERSERKWKNMREKKSWKKL